MVTYQCDGCGREMAKGELRYVVKIDVRAAYDELKVSLADLVRDHRAEILAIIERMKSKDPRELEEAVFKEFELDLCPACQRAFLRGPLRFHPEQGAAEPPIDIDAILRTLGFGHGEDSGGGD